MAKLVDPVSLVPSRLTLDVEVVNTNKTLVKDDKSSLRMHLLDGQSVAFQDVGTGLYLTKDTNNFEWEPCVGSTPSPRQTFQLVESSSPAYPYGIRSMSGDYLGTDLVSFLKIPVWRWTGNLGGWESFAIRVKSVNNV